VDALPVGGRVKRAFLLTAPLLMENAAISRWIQESGRRDLREALPELTSIREAVDMATADLRLSPMEQQQLRTVLKRQYPTA
jgi:hypothetical protein